VLDAKGVEVANGLEEGAGVSENGLAHGSSAGVETEG
jgi:hypothetical protein